MSTYTLYIISECESLKVFIPHTMFRRKPAGDPGSPLGQDNCVMRSSLGRFQLAEKTFNTSFLMSDAGAIPTPQPLIDVPVEDHMLTVTSFNMEETSDIGGTFALHATLNLKDDFNVRFYDFIWGFLTVINKYFVQNLDFCKVFGCH